MGQKTHPTGFRIAVTEQWRSRWYAGKKDFAKFLLEDQKIRRFIKKEWAFAAIPKFALSAEASYHWSRAPFAGHDFNGLGFAVSGHWYVK